VPRSQPALAEHQQMTAKAATVGFDWENAGQVIDKLDEELRELAAARESGAREHIEHELGVILGTVVNLARFFDIDAEQALRKANARFRRRFAYVEDHSTLPGATIDEMEKLWQQAKAQETKAAND
jgi:uncharacterized protein YabN with tetrapyrrole methylase and pyrophosphatase domain